MPEIIYRIDPLTGATLEGQLEDSVVLDYDTEVAGNPYVIPNSQASSNEAIELRVDVESLGSITASSASISSLIGSVSEANEISSFIEPGEPSTKAQAPMTYELTSEINTFTLPTSGSTEEHIPYIDPLTGETYDKVIYGAITIITSTVSDFTGVPRFGNEPLSVSFTATATGTVSDWFWEFGDGGTIHEQNPTHIYTNPGLYNVTLWTLIGDDNYQNTKSNYIQVATIPIEVKAAANYEYNFAQGYSVNYSG